MGLAGVDALDHSFLDIESQHLEAATRGLHRQRKAYVTETDHPEGETGGFKTFEGIVNHEEPKEPREGTFCARD